MQTLTSNELIAMINTAKHEQDALESQIRDLRLRHAGSSEWLSHLRKTRDKMIIEAMRPSNVEVAMVATEYGVSRTWVWKLCKKTPEES